MRGREGGLFERGLNRGFMVVAGHNLGTFVHCLHPLSLFTYLLIFKTVLHLFSDTSQARTSGFSRS